MASSKKKKKQNQKKKKHSTRNLRTVFAHNELECPSQNFIHPRAPAISSYSDEVYPVDWLQSRIAKEAA